MNELYDFCRMMCFAISMIDIKNFIEYLNVNRFIQNILTK